MNHDAALAFCLRRHYGRKHIIRTHALLVQRETGGGFVSRGSLLPHNMAICLFVPTEVVCARARELA